MQRLGWSTAKCALEYRISLVSWINKFLLIKSYQNIHTHAFILLLLDIGDMFFIWFYVYFFTVFS